MNMKTPRRDLALLRSHAHQVMQPKLRSLVTGGEVSAVD